MEMSKLILVSLTLVWCLGAGIVQGFTYDDKEVETEEGKSAMFERWRSHHKLEGSRDKKKQYNNFKANLELVHKTNKAQKSYKLEMNKFAGMNIHEFKSLHTGALTGAPKIKPGKKLSGRRNFTEIPPAVDWRNHNAVTRVKNQGTCGSCYAFATVDAIEGLHAIRTGELLELSAKEILDCSNCGNCEMGGYMHQVYEYVRDNGGVTSEEIYPYTQAVQEPCNKKKEHDIVVEIHGYQTIHNDEAAFQAAVAKQPVQVAVECEEVFQLYKEGVFDAPCGTMTSHAVLVVGYDTTPEGVPYWITKNSWGEEWGEKGYMRLLRGVPQKEGHCGINLACHFPTVEDSGPQPKEENEPRVHGSRGSRDL